MGKEKPLEKNQARARGWITAWGGAWSPPMVLPVPAVPVAMHGARMGWHEPGLMHSSSGQAGQAIAQGVKQDFILPQTPAQTVCGCHIWLLLPEEQLPRLLPEPKGRKPAFPGQTGGDIVTSLSCKLLNTTSCQGPLPTAPSPHADTLEPGWDHQPSPSQMHQPGQRGAPRRPETQPACGKHPASEERTGGLLICAAITFLSRAGSIL